MILFLWKTVRSQRQKRKLYGHCGSTHWRDAKMEVKLNKKIQWKWVACDTHQWHNIPAFQFSESFECNFCAFIGTNGKKKYCECQNGIPPTPLLTQMQNKWQPMPFIFDAHTTVNQTYLRQTSIITQLKWWKVWQGNCIDGSAQLHQFDEVHEERKTLAFRGEDGMHWTKKIVEFELLSSDFQLFLFLCCIQWNPPSSGSDTNWRRNKFQTMEKSI